MSSSRGRATRTVLRSVVAPALGALLTTGASAALADGPAPILQPVVTPPHPSAGNGAAPLPGSPPVQPLPPGVVPPPGRAPAPRPTAYPPGVMPAPGPPPPRDAGPPVVPGQVPLPPGRRIRPPGTVQPEPPRETPPGAPAVRPRPGPAAPPDSTRRGVLELSQKEPPQTPAEAADARANARRSSRQMPGDPHGGCAGAGSLRRRGPA